MAHPHPHTHHPTVAPTAVVDDVNHAQLSPPDSSDSETVPPLPSTPSQRERPLLPLPSRLLLLLLFYPSTVLSSSPSSLCNVNTPRACECMHGRPSESHIVCESFLESSELSVVSVVLRALLSSPPALHRRRLTLTQLLQTSVAKVVTAYCTRQQHDCAGISLPATSSNIVVLRVKIDPTLNTTTFHLAALNNHKLTLNKDNIIEPPKVKYMLEASASELSRMMGGVRVKEISVSRMKRVARADDGDNTKLMLIAACVAAFFLISYLIGIIKLVRNCKRKRREQEAKREQPQTEMSEMMKKKEEKANYGALHNNHNGALNASNQQDKLNTTTDAQQVEEGNSMRPRLLTERQMKLMFGCDPSQLPKEMSFDDERSEALRNERSGGVPSVVLVSETPREERVGEEDVVKMREGETKTTEEDMEDFLTHRPKSRRGSRVDDTLDNIDLTERLPDTKIYHPPTPQHPERWSSSEGEVDMYYKLSEEEDNVKGDEWPDKLRSVGGTGEEDGDENEEEQQKNHNSVFVVKSNRLRAPVDDEQSSDEDDEHHVYERLREEASPIPPPPQSP